MAESDFRNASWRAVSVSYVRLPRVEMRKRTGHNSQKSPVTYEKGHPLHPFVPSRSGLPTYDALLFVRIALLDFHQCNLWRKRAVLKCLKVLPSIQDLLRKLAIVFKFLVNRLELRAATEARKHPDHLTINLVLSFV